jgi:hypothetical protein
VESGLIRWVALGRWSEWLSVPVRYCDLPLSSQLAITLWDLAGPGKLVPFGGTTVALFEKDKYAQNLPFPKKPFRLAKFHTLAISRKEDRSVSYGSVSRLTALVTQALRAQSSPIVKWIA